MEAAAGYAVTVMQKGMFGGEWVARGTIDRVDLCAALLFGRVATEAPLPLGRVATEASLLLGRVVAEASLLLGRVGVLHVWASSKHEGL